MTLPYQPDNGLNTSDQQAADDAAEYLTQRVVVIDAGVEYADRWTAIVDDDHDAALAMSDHPFHPQGVGMHVTASREYVASGIRVAYDDLPADVQRCIRQEIALIDQWHADHPKAGR